MIKCKECGKVASKFETRCPDCKAEYKFSRLEIEDSLDEARSAIKKREYEYALSIYKALADMGVTDAEREYALLLERGSIIPRDLDGAMKYFFEAAKKNDPLSAFKYSRLAARTSDKASEFWLTYAALLGCKEAFSPAAEHYSDIGDEETAGFYYSLAAHGDDTDAIVTMAKRYYNGIGTERSEEYAKWYMDKLTLPPLHALKLAYRLRSVMAKIPPEPTFTSRTRILRSLIRDAKKYSLDSAHIFMAELLAKSGGADALYSLGVLYAEGVGGRVRINDAITCLERAIDAGSKEAAKYLGDMFAQGKLVERDINRSLEYYQRSAGMGEGSAYEILGDMFAAGTNVDINIAYAIDLYDLGSREGDQACRTKAARLRDQREEFYQRAKSSESSDPGTAFECYAASAAMGYLPAHRDVARCFELGIGTKKNRKKAYLWYNLAVECGDTDSLYDLGRCFARGIGTAFDFDRAVEILTRARRYGSSAAEGEILRLFGNKKRSMVRSIFSNAIRLIYNKKFEPAFELLSGAAECGDAEAYYVLGCMHEFGLGVPTSRARAFECYNTAFDMNFRDPRQIYKLKILKMAR